MASSSILVCRRCLRPYSPKGGGHCGGCHETFRSDSAFDKHRVGPFTDRRCLTPAEMETAGWRDTERGWTPYPQWTGPHA